MICFLRTLTVVILTTYCSICHAQVLQTETNFIEDTSLGPKPSLKIENLSPLGHCDNQQLNFFVPWADRYEILQRRTDTAWVNDNKHFGKWFSQTVKKNVSSMIYKRLDEHGTYEFQVKAYKGNLYRSSDIVSRPSCIDRNLEK